RKESWRRALERNREPTSSLNREFYRLPSEGRQGSIARFHSDAPAREMEGERSILSRAGLAAAIAAAAVLGGCPLGPDFKRPAAPDVDGYTPEPLAPHTASATVAGGAAQNFIAGKDIPGAWWDL